MKAKVEAADVARSHVDTGESKTEELKLQLEKYVKENNENEFQVEETVQDTGKILVVADK